MITLESVGKVIKGNSVLEDISFTINPKELVCITGPSGAGKSTLLHLMIGAEQLTSGKIIIDGVALNDLPPTVLQLFRRRVGVVFQDYKLLWNRTVYENVAFPLEVCGIPQKLITNRVAAVLKDLGLQRKSNMMTSALSGGEKARTAIARAIVHNPMILLADEPTGNLDPEQTSMILDLLQLIQKHGTTVVLATHEVDIVDRLQTRVIRLEEGKVIRDSVGGYEDETTKSAAAAEAKEHKIFDKIPPASSSPGKNKIKIISIHS